MTPKRRQFAVLVAQGLTQVAAYNQVYGQTKAKAKDSRIRQASTLARIPEVKQAIAAAEERFLPVGDLRTLRDQMLASIRHLATYGRDEKVRLAAAIDLRNYVDQREERDRIQNRKPITIDGIMSEIRQLEAPEPTIEIETVDASEAAGEESGATTVLETAADGTPEDGDSETDGDSEETADE
jgi:hypothetical protein